MPLARLLSVVVLSPAQASLVAVRLLDATQMSGTANGAHPADACLWAVTLAPSGEVEVARGQAGEGTAVTELLAQLSQNARRLPTHPRSEQLVLLRRLEEAAADSQLEPGPRARELEGALTEVLGSGAWQRLSGQLAALVGAFAHIAPSIAVPVGAQTAAAGYRSDPHRAAPPRSKPSRPPWRQPVAGHRRARTRRTALLVLLLAAAVAGSTYIALRNPDGGGAGARDRDRDGPPAAAAPSDPSKERPAKQPRSRPRPGIATLAGRQAAPITDVGVQLDGACTPGRLCPLTVTVRFRPASTPQPVTWKVGTTRSCGGSVTWSPPVTVTAQPGWTTVYAASSVPVTDRSRALVALTTAPARAQSPPVSVTGSALQCQ